MTDLTLSQRLCVRLRELEVLLHDGEFYGTGDEAASTIEALEARVQELTEERTVVLTRAQMEHALEQMRAKDTVWTFPGVRQSTVPGTSSQDAGVESQARFMDEGRQPETLHVCGHCHGECIEAKGLVDTVIALQADRDKLRAENQELWADRRSLIERLQDAHKKLVLARPTEEEKIALIDRLIADLIATEPKDES